MKKFAILIALVITPFFANAQGLFDSYENEDDVTSVVVTKNMFKLLSKIDIDSGDEDVQEYLNMVNSLENMKVFITENKSVGLRMKADVEKYVNKSKGLEELMRVKDGDQNIKFYSREGKDENHVSELLMFLNGEMDGKKGSVVMSITGDIDLKQISKLTKQLNVPGSDKLDDIDKKR